MTDSPLITTIIPTYRRPELLKRAVRSVLFQSFPDFQVLIADNASGQKTEEVVKELMSQDSRVKYLKHEKNIGMTANFQAALMQTATPFVSFLPDDDFLGPCFFEQAMRKMTQYPEIAFCGGGGLIIDQKGVVKSIQTLRQTIPASGYYTSPEGFFTYIYTAFGIAFPSLLFRTSILKELGGCDLRVSIGVDEDLISKCAARFPVYLITDSPFYFGFQHEGSLSRKIDFETYENDCLHLHENILKVPFLLKQREEVDFFFKKRRLKILSNAYRHYYNLKEFSQARRFAEKLYTVTGAFKWRKKRVQTLFYEKIPLLSSVENTLKTVEKRLRHFLRKKKQSDSVDTKCVPMACEKWKEYVALLEERHTSS